MQLNKVILDDIEKQKLVKCFKNEICHKNFCMFLTLSKIFCFSSEDALIYMDSWFLVISETKDFLQLEENLLVEILSRSSLLVTTEIEIYQAADKWINYSLSEREKSSKRLLHKVRLPLLGEKTLKTILTEKSCFRKNKDSLAVVENILKQNFDFYKNKPSKFFTPRYCGHDSFSILYFGGYDKTKIASKTVCDKIVQIKHSDEFKNPKIVSSLAEKRYYYIKAVKLRGNVYIFGGFDENYKFVKEVEMYSHVTKTCKVVANIEYTNNDKFRSCAVCGFMDKIYLFGGYSVSDRERSPCMEFDTKSCSWKRKSQMIKKREFSAASVYREKIVVSGGLQFVNDDEIYEFVNFYDNDFHKALNTVEAYDPIDNTYIEFPNMNYSRCSHQSLVVKNKLFVIAGGTPINEVYDSTSKSFAVLKQSLGLYNINSIKHPFAAFKVSHNLFVYFWNSSATQMKLFCFDTNKGEWYEKPSKSTENLASFSAIQVPRL